MEKSIKEERIRAITHLYYSRPEIQKAIYEFAKNREISPRFFEGFGKRPDTFQYPGDVFQFVKNGATSFHCSEELWEDPLKIETGMTTRQANEIRMGWDLLIDIDCKWFEFSKLATKAILKVLTDNGMKNIGLKFSGSKGFHILVPWKAFPKNMNTDETKNLFPDLPRKIAGFIRFQSEKEMKNMLPDNFSELFKDADLKKGIKCQKCSEIVNEYEQIDFNCENCHMSEHRKLEVGNKIEFKCPNCSRPFVKKNVEALYECSKCEITSLQDPDNFSKTISNDLFELMGLDLILVSPRHLFRMPYSLHEKTALASMVMDLDQLDSFEMKNASPLNIQIKNFMPECEENEAGELVMQALDWYSMNVPEEFRPKSSTGKFANYKEIELKNLNEDQFPPCVKKMLEGVGDGRKRALFALLNLFRSVGLDKEELEKKLYDWNEKNEVPLKKGYVKSQLDWAYKRKPLMPPNCKEFYQGIGCCSPDGYCQYVKNPVNYVVKKNFSANKNGFTNKKKVPAKKKITKKKET